MPLTPLVLHQDYTRRDVHDAFDPESAFTPQRGSWGIWGLIPLPDRPGDFVFLVTYGQRQGEHTFDEGISSDGVLRWQSQPRQSLTDRVISQLIQHDEDRQSISLFLRSSERRGGDGTPYTYLGRLKYLAHDRQRERPVHFLWQLLDWPIPPAIVNRIGLSVESEPDRKDLVSAQPSFAGELLEEPAPTQNRELGASTQNFRATKGRRISEDETAALGLAGEILVLHHEQRKLRDAGRDDLAERVRHTAIVEGDGAGFDVRSFFFDGRIKYIKVKTTT
jgi:hypothetical protein